MHTINTKEQIHGERARLYWDIRTLNLISTILLLISLIALATIMLFTSSPWALQGV